MREDIASFLSISNSLQTKINDLDFCLSSTIWPKIVILKLIHIYYKAIIFLFGFCRLKEVLLKQY